MKEFRIHFEQEQFDDLRRRLERTRLPRPFLGEGWEFGVEPACLTALLDRWREGYDWRKGRRS